MPKFKIKGESVVQWELVVQGEPRDAGGEPLDYLDANKVAIEYVNDMLQLDTFPLGQVVGAEVTGQTDRIIKNVEVD